MKLFTTLALVSAIASSNSVMAMQALDDETLSAATGQDGITITLNTTAAGIGIEKLYLHDNDGLDATLAEAGALELENIKLTTGSLAGGVWTSAAGTLAKVKIDTDNGGTIATSDDAFLNVNVELGDVNIALDSINVGASGTTSTTLRRGIATGVTKIVSGYTDTDKLGVTVGGSKLNIQLGNTPQGAMIIASGNVANGLNISNVALVDHAGGGVIGVDGIRITDANSANLTANAKISVVNNSAAESGLKVTLGSTAQDMYLSGIRLGGNYTTGTSTISDGTNVGTATFNANSIASIGDVELQGLNLNATSIVISGH